MTEYRYYRVQVEQTIPATQVLRRVIEVEVKVPSNLDEKTEDNLALLACNVAEKEAEKLNFKETINPECDEEMIKNEPEYYVHTATDGHELTHIVAVDSIGVC